MVLPLIMKTEKNFKSEKILKYVQFCYFYRALRKTSVLKIAAKAFEAGDFDDMSACPRDVTEVQGSRKGGLAQTHPGSESRSGPAAARPVRSLPSDPGCV